RAVGIAAGSGPVGGGTTPASGPVPASAGSHAPAVAPRRRTLWVAAVALIAALTAGVVWSRRAQPIWQPAEGDAVAVGAQLDRTIRRVLDEETARFSDLAGRAGKVPQLANAITGRVDEETFQD